MIHPIPVAIAAAGLAGMAYQLDQVARVILVEVGPPPKTLDEEAAGIARVIFNRARKYKRLPSQIIRVRRGEGIPVLTLRLDTYLGLMAARGPTYKGYKWAYKRAAAALFNLEGGTVGGRLNWVHLNNAWFDTHPVPAWARVNALTIGRTTFSGGRA